MRILEVITGLGVGGAERLVTNLVDRFAAEGHEVVLVCMQGEVELKPRDSTVRVVNLQMRKTPVSVARCVWQLRHLVRDFRPDVVNGHMFYANVLTRLLRITMAVPRVISSVHSNNDGGGGTLRMLAYRYTNRLADTTTILSQEARQAFVDRRAVSLNRAITVCNGVDAENFVFGGDARERLRSELSVTSSAPLLLAVGRLAPEKDFSNLLRAAKKLLQQGYDFQLWMAGDGPQRDELEALTSSLGLEAHVLFLGVREDVSQLMSACDVFVLSSAWEGFGLVVAEAMACERRVVSTNYGGVAEVVGDAGWLAPPEDSDALAEQLIQALDCPADKAATFGKAARQRIIEHYSLAATAQGYLSVYRGELPAGSMS